MAFPTSPANSWLQRSLATQSIASQWMTHWKSASHHESWFIGLIAIGSFSSALYAHPPLVALGTVAGSTLPPRKAIGAAIAIWLANQILDSKQRINVTNLQSLTGCLFTPCQACLNS